jgi:hypothetical protein
MGKGGGSPAPAPSQQTVTQTSIPEYARPYVENMLGKSEALTDINANPYQAYGGQRIQDFTPMQQQAFQGVGNMQVAPEIGAGSNLAALSGLGSIGAGGNYMNMATDPRSIQQFMSPYMQNVVDMQKQEATRDYQKGLGALNARAVGSGAFGGTRAALERSEAGRNLGTQLANIQAQGSQNAFQAAQQAQQFGAGLGLQGMGQGLQAASTLGQLGQTGYGQRMGILGEQQKVGAVQQAQGQQALDLGYQDFLKQKNYPYQQLAYMSDMLRGLPLSQSAQQVYTAPPNVASQLGGLGMAGLGIYGMSGGFKPGGMAEGGSVKGYKEGGSIGYLSGGEVKMMSTEQLEQLLASPNLNPLELEMVEKALMARRRMEMNPQAGEMMARSGIGAISTGDMVPEEMAMAANGGIIAFSEGGSSKQKRADYMNWLEGQIKADIEAQKTDNPFAESDAERLTFGQDIKARRQMAPFMALANAGFATARGQSPYALSNLGLGGEKGLETYAKSMSDEAADKRALLQQGVEAGKSKFARQTGLTGQMSTSLGQLYGREAALEQAAASDRRIMSDKDLRLQLQMEKTYLDKVQGEKAILAKTQKYNQLTDAQLEEMAKKNINARLTPRQKEILFGGKETEIPTPTPAPAPAPAPGSKSFPKPSNAAISALKSRQDLDKAKEQFDAIFGPGAATKALGK